MHDNKSRTKLHIAITIAVMAIIFIHSALPSNISAAESGWIAEFIARIFGLEQQTISFLVRKAAHFTEFFVLAICLGVNVRDHVLNRGQGNNHDEVSVRTGTQGESGNKLSFRRIAIPAWLLSTLYAITDEIHQMWVPGRACQVRDMLIDSAGAVLGAVIVAIVIMHKYKKR